MAVDKTQQTEAPQTGAPEQKNKELLDDVKERAEDVMEDIKEGATSLWEKIRAGAERALDFAKDASELGKLKIEIHRLENSLAKRFLQMGERVWELNKKQKLGEVKTALAEDFQEIETLKRELKSKRKKKEAISLVN